MENQITVTNKSAHLEKRLETFSTQQVSNLSQIFAETSLPAIATLKNEVGEITVKSILVDLIFSLTDFFNVPKMTDGQVAETTSLLMDEFYYLKPEDFKLCFTNAKKGNYGQIFNRIDGQILFEWLNKYMVERTEFVAVKKQNDNSPRSEAMLSISELREKLYGRAKKEAEEQYRKEAILKKNKEQWEIDARIEWHESKKAWMEETGRAEAEYHHFFPYKDFETWYIKKQIEKI